MAALLGVALLSAPMTLEDRFLSVGANAGLHLLDGPPAFQVGGEVSLVWASLGKEWQGVYADAIWVPDADLVQLSAGAELGYWFIGMDAGIVAALADGEDIRYGARVRAIGSIGFVGGYAGFGALGGRGAFSEIGVLVKAPIPF